MRAIGTILNDAICHFHIEIYLDHHFKHKYDDNTIKVGQFR